MVFVYVMNLKSIALISAVFAAVFLFGWYSGRHSRRNAVRGPEIKPIEGVIPIDTMEKQMIEISPDTVFVRVPGPTRIVYVEGDAVVRTDTLRIPVETLIPGPTRDSAIDATLIDWNTKRSYTGVLFDDPAAGRATYSFDVQYNRSGAIRYTFDPAPISKPRIRLRPTIGGEYYSNGQYGFGAGVQYGGFGANVRALKIENPQTPGSYAFGLGVQFVF